MPEQQHQQRVFNRTFKGVPELSRFNACVGDNGQPDLPEYASGFMDAALHLGELVIKNNVKHSVDEFIYPIAFNMRHSVEVWLKYFLKQLKSIRSDKILDPYQNVGTEKIITDNDMTRTHNINIFWDWFKFNSENRDFRFMEINKQLDGYIADIGEIDPTGQTFRYPYNTESQKHLVKTPIINLFNLTQRILELKKIIQDLKSLLSTLKYEYKTGTYTKNLSREQLNYISSQLPQRTDWSLPAFEEVRNGLKKELNIGSKELSEALKIIQSHYEFAQNIGIAVQLKSASKDDLCVFIDTWLVFHDEKLGETEKIDVFMDINQQKKEHDSLMYAIRNIDLSSQADIGAIFYLARSPEYSELYEELFNSELIDATHNIAGDGVAMPYLYHFLSKVNFINNMVISLKLLGQTELLKELQKKYDVVKQEIAKNV